MRCRGYKGKDTGFPITDVGNDRRGNVENDREGNQERVSVFSSPLPALSGAEG